MNLTLDFKDIKETKIKHNQSIKQSYSNSYNSNDNYYSNNTNYNTNSSNNKKCNSKNNSQEHEPYINFKDILKYHQHLLKLRLNHANV